MSVVRLTALRLAATTQTCVRNKRAILVADLWGSLAAGGHMRSWHAMTLVCAQNHWRHMMFNDEI